MKEHYLQCHECGFHLGMRWEPKMIYCSRSEDHLKDMNDHPQSYATLNLLNKKILQNHSNCPNCRNKDANIRDLQAALTQFGNKKSISEYINEVHQNAKEKGFYKDYENLDKLLTMGVSLTDGLSDLHTTFTKARETHRTNFLAQRLALIHSEVSEALEELRVNGLASSRNNGKPEGFMSEISDIIIRCFDLVGYLEQDLQTAIDEKIAYNKTRPPMHGGKKI